MRMQKYMETAILEDTREIVISMVISVKME